MTSGQGCSSVWLLTLTQPNFQNVPFDLQLINYLQTPRLTVDGGAGFEFLRKLYITTPVVTANRALQQSPFQLVKSHNRICWEDARHTIQMTQTLSPPAMSCRDLLYRSLVTATKLPGQWSRQTKKPLWQLPRPKWRCDSQGRGSMRALGKGTWLQSRSRHWQRAHSWSCWGSRRFHQRLF